MPEIPIKLCKICNRVLKSSNSDKDSTICKFCQKEGWKEEEVTITKCQHCGNLVNVEFPEEIDPQDQEPKEEIDYPRDSIYSDNPYPDE